MSTALKWSDYEAENYSQESNALSHFKAALINTVVDTRNERGLTQRQLAELTGIKQPVIARFERNQTDPQLSTVIKILFALGKTMEVVALPESQN